MDESTSRSALEVSTAFEGLDDAMRLESPLFPTERLEVVRGTTVCGGSEQVALVRAGDAQCELEGVGTDLVRALLTAIDDGATVGELHRRFDGVVGAQELESILRGLIGAVLHIRIDPEARVREAKSLVVVDGFLDDPDVRRAEALRAEYRPVEWFLFPGLFSVHAPDNVDATMRRIQQILGVRLLWGEGPIHGHYRWSTSGDARRAGANVHVDPFSWNAVLCLTPTERCRGGISFYRHRATGLHGADFASLRTFGGDAPAHRQLVSRLVSEEGANEAAWHEVGRVDLRYNRLILFDPRQFHRTNAQFGATREDGRITQGFSCFACDDPYRYKPWA
jgi:hypothetical protein